MCKIIAGFQENPTQEFEDFILAQIPQMNKEDDGIGMLIIDKDRKVFILRELVEYFKVWEFLKEKSKEIKFLLVHTRTGTSGTKSLKNIHLFQNGDWTFVHNGFVTKYHSSSLEDFSKYYNHYPHKKNKFKELEKTERKENETACDSLQFLNSLPQKLTKSILESKVEEAGFSGMGFLVNLKTFQSFMLVKKEVKLVKGNEFTAFLSFDPTLKVEKIQIEMMHNIPYYEKKAEEKISCEIREVMRGVFESKV